ncbi:leishmanolysin family protein (macronuclear) [Tetrahymena thermophila SB210]|uniref:Leishmanolysin family protein n=1 Tax=Tetrahymena thermophila (strain SB210) TaxID=312017 RepID=Q22Z95_TETTS|nr:leishmanolysin family protein [Tetrahymena thermophila SB210]EAR90426.1 leishmanolysin family protein [Tetrahymena thermophila SB210]|eukprot:XP_001010671.1 leishmanolysin family protein [Tetrahymena thermophila SB210]
MPQTSLRIKFFLLMLALLCSLTFANLLLDTVHLRDLKIINTQTQLTENDNSSRNLSGSTIRFTYDDQLVQKSNNRLHIKIIQDALKSAFNFYEQFIQVKNPILSGLEVDCDFDLLPDLFKKTVYNTDIHFIVGLDYDEDSWLASAGPCGLQKTDNRPIIGFIIYNQKYLPSEDNGSFSSFEYDYLIKVTIHEMFHALVFHDDLYQYYVNSTPEQYGINLHKKPFLALPEVLSFTQQHFGCSDIKEVYLEDISLEGTAGCHWKKSLFYSDLMTGFLNSGDVTWSGINNALLKDSGWYDVKMDFHDRLFWGKDKGCDFYFQTCNEKPLPKEFCDLSNEKNSTGYNYEGYNFKCQPLFPNTCPVQYSLNHTSCYGRVDKLNLIENTMENFGSSFGWNSKAVISSLSPKNSHFEVDPQQIQCYPQECIQKGDKISIHFTIGSKIDKIQNVICEEDDQILTVDQYDGQLICPKINNFCKQQFICKNHCNGRGFCMNQTCICAKGYSGEDCSIDNSNQEEEQQILDANCNSYDDKNECINCQKGFQLIGGSCQKTSQQILLIQIFIIAFYLILI